METFVNALQLDGNNPLAYDGTAFELLEDIAARADVPARMREAAAACAGACVTPGQLAARRALHRAVTRSALYDRALHMYVLNAPLARATREIGRANIFPPGWLENQSVWLHMEYKYLLALLRAGLHKEFFAAVHAALIPFQPPRRYGRSPLEHSSFIANSAHPDTSIHGAGFYARLSGATIEFISMWLEMNGTARMFSVDEHGVLRCRLQPVLPAAYFNRRPVTRVWHNSGGEQAVTIPKDACAFVIFSRTLLVYHNPLRRDTFGPYAVHPRRYDGSSGKKAAVIGA